MVNPHVISFIHPISLMPYYSVPILVYLKILYRREKIRAHHLNCFSLDFFLTADTFCMYGSKTRSNILLMIRINFKLKCTI